jgi:translation initiation factor IF-1
VNDEWQAPAWLRAGDLVMVEFETYDKKARLEHGP